MVIKKFQGKTESEATEAAKKELGPNVVVMNVRTVKRGGFFSFLRSPLIEVTVGLEEESPKEAARVMEPDPGILNFNTAISEAAQAVTETLKEHDSLDLRVEDSTPVRTGISRVSQVRTSAQVQDKSAIEDRLDDIRNLIEENLAKNDSDKPEANTALEEEKESETVMFLKLLYNTMIENEIDEKYVNQFVEDLEKMSNPNVPMDYMLSNVYQKMVLKFGNPATIAEAKEKPKVLFFIGPTGVGKTTTIAKLASKLCMEEHKKVVLLTADTYRIAAAEQLRTYASILDVPFRVIYSIEEIQNAIQSFRSSDYILVDTAGHSHNNEQQRETMAELLHSVDEICEKETYLVVSATTKYRDLLSIADTYTKMTNYRLIFTKLDETSALGNLLNLRLHTGAEMSYVTYGQNVPDDISVFQPQKTVKQLLSDRR